MHSLFSRAGDESEDQMVIMDADDINLSETANTEEWIPTKQLEDIFDYYRLRTWDEELREIQNLGGIQNILARLKTSERGLSETEAETERRREKYGINGANASEPSTFLELCQEALGDVTMRILLISGIISLILGATINPHSDIRWIDGVAIIVAVIIVVIVTALNEKQKNKKFTQLRYMKKECLEVQILENGKNTFKKPDQLLVGDVIVI